MASKSRLNRISERAYEQLTGPQRLELVIEQAAAGNASEAARIAAACPEFSYRGRDICYQGRAQAAVQMAREVCREIRSARLQIALAQLAMQKCSAACQLAIAGWKELWPGEGASGTKETLSSAERGGRLFLARQAADYPMRAMVHRELYVPALIALKVEWRAFDACSRERLGVPGKMLLKVLGNAGYGEWPTWFESELERLELEGHNTAETEMIEHARKAYEDCFKCVPKEEEK